MADSISFDFSGSRKIIDILGTLPVHMAAQVMSKVRESAQATLDDAQSMAPVDTGALSQSGHLRVSTLKIEVVFGDGQSTPTIYSYSNPSIEADGYTWFQELGTTRCAAQPYLGPAFDYNSQALLDALAGIAL